MIILLKKKIKLKKKLIKKKNYLENQNINMKLNYNNTTISNQKMIKCIKNSTKMFMKYNKKLV